MRMKQKPVRSNEVKSRRKRALAVIARAGSGDVPAGVKLVDFRQPSPDEQVHGKSLDSRARALLSAAKHAAKNRRLAISH